MAEERSVHIVEWPKERLLSEMQMDVHTREPIQVCITLCNEICVKSEYAIDIVVFDRPVSTITLRGQTTIYNCPNDEGLL